MVTGVAVVGGDKHVANKYITASNKNTVRKSSRTKEGRAVGARSP